MSSKQNAELQKRESARVNGCAQETSPVDRRSSRRLSLSASELFPFELAPELLLESLSLETDLEGAGVGISRPIAAAAAAAASKSLQGTQICERMKFIVRNKHR